MENFLNPYDKEYMRVAILKHEETFKQQVHELHRLYRIQKLLMRNIRKENPKTQQNRDVWNSSNHKSFAETKLDSENVIDESEIELTLGPSSYSRRRKNNNKTDTPLTSDSGPSFSSSSTGSSHNRNTKVEESNGHNIDQLGLFRVPHLTNLGSYKNQNQPPWLFQALSLNMT